MFLWDDVKGKRFTANINTKEDVINILSKYWWVLLMIAVGLLIVLLWGINKKK
ncbi:MAG: hypothetical protein AABX28_02840 [Nanoarchaeota archaeon]